ncbi:MAG: DUF3748 domain-containing protein [bacterium]|nr:DUF3748 domain-containing protein [bacterium]
MTTSHFMAVALIGAILCGAATAAERQITYSPKNHDLDNNDNFSPDGRFLCYDTRETVGVGIDNSQTIEKVEIATGIETVLYAPPSIIGEKAAPGVGAVTFHPIFNRVAFIHGPPVDTVPERGYYGKPNRNGAEVIADSSQSMVWLDHRDVATDRATLPGAHRGGTHRHEYAFDGKRVGFTYDDFLLPQYDRTIGYMEPNAKAPGGATHFFALLVACAPKDTAKPGEIEKAYGDSWIGREGLMRAFIGKVRKDDGVEYEESLFVVDVPRSVDIATAKAGSAKEYPTPPKGLRIRRLTHDWASGIVRGTQDGQRIAYYAHAADGSTQIFIVPSDGSDRDPDPAKRPVQATSLPGGAGPGLRWHPSGDYIACISSGAVVATCVKQGPDFGKSEFLTAQGEEDERFALVWSHDGALLAYNKAVPSYDQDGMHARSYSDADFHQIFVVPFELP